MSRASFLRFLGSCGIGAVLCGCASGPPPMKALASADVQCIDSDLFGEGNPIKPDIGLDFRNAVSRCGHRVPDLTGDNRLQQIALDQKMPFTIRPMADAYLKDHDTTVVIGGLIPSRKMDRDTGPITAGPIVASGNR